MRGLIVILIVALLSILLVGGFYYFQEKEPKEEEPKEEVVVEEEPEFDEEFIKNDTVSVYCPLSLEDGVFSTENLSFYCEDDNLPEKPFSLSVIDVVFFDESHAVLAVSSAVEDLPQRYDLLAVNKEEQFAGYMLEKEPLSLQWSGDFLEVTFKEKKEKYRLIADRFEEVVDESTFYGSAEHGFFVRIPDNWKVEKRGDSFLFYHPLSIYTHPITMKIEKEEKGEYSLHGNGRFYNIYMSANNPYREVYEMIKNSLAVNEIHALPDYSFFEDDLKDYLKVDTEKGVLIYYKEGEEVEEFEILNMIDRENWGGTPAGLYEVLSKEGLRFSTTSEVYMPFSIRFYGKYLIHGEPYYPSGHPYTHPVSGGCIRVKNERMELLYDLLEEETPVLVLPKTNGDFTPKEERVAPFPHISADSYLVADIDSGKVFAEKNAKEAKPIASITKIMTGLVIAEHFSTEHHIRVQEYMLTGYGETAGIYAGRVFRLVDLLPPLLIESSNNAAKVLASFFGEDDTVERMNEKAEMIGMTDTAFTDSSGIEDGNISTAKDIYYLAYYLANSRVPFLNISRRVWTPVVNYSVFPNLQNKNLFYADPQFIGGKSGFINVSKHTGFYLFNMNLGGEERRVVFILLGSDTKDSVEREVRELRGWLESSFD